VLGKGELDRKVTVKAHAISAGARKKIEDAGGSVEILEDSGMANPIPNLFRIPELKQKILFTLAILLIYRFGAHVTAPGINVRALEEQFAQLQGTLFGVYDMFVGGALSRATVFSLGIMPYISASIMFQLLAAVFPTIEKMQKEGEEGRKKLTQWTRYTTVLLCIAQGTATRCSSRASRAPCSTRASGSSSPPP
jgi:preprotein translocase subunit SecY